MWDELMKTPCRKQRGVPLGKGGQMENLQRALEKRCPFLKCRPQDGGRFTLPNVNCSANTSHALTLYLREDPV